MILAMERHDWIISVRGAGDAMGFLLRADNETEMAARRTALDVALANYSGRHVNIALRAIDTDPLE